MRGLIVNQEGDALAETTVLDDNCGLLVCTTVDVPLPTADSDTDDDILGVLDTDVLPEPDCKGLFDTSDVSVGPTEPEGEITGVSVFDLRADTLIEADALIDVLGLGDGIDDALCDGPIDGEFEFTLDGDNEKSALTEALEEGDGNGDIDTETDTLGKSETRAVADGRTDSEGAGVSDACSDGLVVDV